MIGHHNKQKFKMTQSEPKPKLKWATVDSSFNIIDSKLYSHLPLYLNQPSKESDPTPQTHNIWILDLEICKPTSVSFYIEAPPSDTKTNLYFGLFDPKHNKLYTTTLQSIPNTPEHTRFYTASVKYDSHMFKYGGGEQYKIKSTSPFYLFYILTKDFDVAQLIEATLVED